MDKVFAGQDRGGRYMFVKIKLMSGGENGKKGGRERNWDNEILGNPLWFFGRLD